jgi:hypothetical protein
MTAVRFIGVDAKGDDRPIGSLTHNGGQFQLNPPDGVLLQRILGTPVITGKNTYFADKNPELWFALLYTTFTSPYLRATKPGG